MDLIKPPIKSSLSAPSLSLCLFSTARFYDRNGEMILTHIHIHRQGHVKVQRKVCIKSVLFHRPLALSFLSEGWNKLKQIIIIPKNTPVKVTKSVVEWKSVALLFSIFSFPFFTPHYHYHPISTFTSFFSSRTSEDVRPSDYKRSVHCHRTSVLAWVVLLPSRVVLYLQNCKISYVNIQKTRNNI